MHRTREAILLLLVALVMQACGGGGGDIDSMLDDLEGITKETIRIVDRVNAGDMSAMTDMAKLTSKYQSYYSKIQSVGDAQMTAAQERRLEKILDDYRRALASRY
jgi:hypothetical protein